jgi:hypothetical protein
MASFLSAEWFAALNDTLSRVAIPSLGDRNDLCVVLEFVEGPSTAPHAMTLTVNDAGAFAEPGDHLAADAVVRLTYADAEALTRGTLESAVALREGRLKVRGDVQALVPLLDWLLESHTG